MGMDIHNAIKSRKTFIDKYLHNTIDMYGDIHRYLYVFFKYYGYLYRYLYVDIYISPNMDISCKILEKISKVHVDIFINP